MRLKRIALIFAASMIALGVCELAVRVRVAREEAARDAAVRRKLAGPPELGWWELFKPNQDGYFRDAPYRTNSFGFPGPERTVAKPAGTKRIAIIGDSNTQGSGVAYEDNYAARLEAALNAAGNERWEVLNFGVPGFNLWHSVERYKRDGRRFEPDLLVYGFTINDIEGPSYLSLVSCSLDLQRHLASWSRLWRVVGEQLRMVREALSAPAGSYLYELHENYRHDAPAWQDFTKGLDAFVEVASESGACPVLFLHTQLHMLNRFHSFTVSVRPSASWRLGGSRVSTRTSEEHDVPSYSRSNPTQPHA